jgi:Trk K+ transport system NAD-binding subunit
LELLDKDGVETSQFRLPRLVNLLRFGESIPIADGEGQLVAVIVGKGSELADRTVVETLGKLEGVTAVAVLREGDLVVPRGDTRFQEGDQLLAVTALAVDRDLSRLAMARRSDDEPEDSPNPGI